MEKITKRELKMSKQGTAHVIFYFLLGLFLGNVLILVFYHDYIRFILYSGIIIILVLAYICYIMFRINRKGREVEETLKEGFERWKKRE